MTANISFQAKVTQQLNKIADVCESHNPDGKNNTGRLLGIAFFWTMVEKFACAKKEEAWASLEREDLITLPSAFSSGDHHLGESPHFVATAKVSNPRKSFNADALAEYMNKSKYKVPLPFMKEAIEKAKIGDKGAITKTIVER